MEPAITVSQMYDIENSGHAMGFYKKFMMENAGAAAARRLVEAVSSGNSKGVESKRVLVVAGLGNNGGDGMVIARHLAGYRMRPAVRLLGAPDMIKTEESRWNWSLLEKMPKSVSLSYGASFEPARGPDPDVVVDAVFGTGITGAIREPFSSAISYINELDCFKMAVDVPSGMDPQTGDTCNLHTVCDMTVTFHRIKQGIPKRPDLTGILHAEKIGIPPEAEEGIL